MSPPNVGGAVDRMTVLVVEDDAAIRSLICATLPDEWNVVEAADGMEAIELARRFHPDAIILDQNLPMLEGSEVCQVIRREPWAGKTRIVGLTASADRDVRQAMTRAGVDAFVAKPFSPVQLLDLLDAWDTQRV